MPPNDSSTINRKTDVIYGNENAMLMTLQFIDRARRQIDTCGDQNMPSVAMGVPEVRERVLRLSKQGMKLRQITEITKGNLQYCKEFARYVELRHLDGIKGSFSIRDGEEYVGATVLEEAKPVTQTIHSNVKGMVEQHQYLFETLWARAIPADRRIREIEEDRPPEFLKIINDYHEAAQVYLNLSRTVRKEALLVLPDSKALRREYDLGVLQQLAQASNESGATIRIICPLDDANSEIVRWLASTAPRIQILNGEQSKSTVIVADNERLFRAESKESGKEEQTDFASSIGFSVYANSRPSVDSFRTFFELLWSAISMSEQLKKAHMLQKEFINIAAHELRSPIQPILGYAELLEYSHTPEQKEGVQGIIRNALRLQKLTDDMLDVARIENNSLKLDRKKFDLDELLATASGDARKQLDSKSVKLLYDSAGQVLVLADKYRIAQVIFNLLSNAIKFTEKGEILVTLERRGNEALVRVADSGPGIDHDIFPRLFTKFATKSDGGTGLGLYIAKSIVEAHGGRIWAEEGVKGKGAVFGFTVPLLSD